MMKYWYIHHHMLIGYRLMRDTLPPELVTYFEARCAE